MMKLKLALVFSFFVHSLSFAHSVEKTFAYDENNVMTEFTALSKLENYVQAHDGITLEEVKKNKGNLLENMNLSSDISPVMNAENGRSMPLIGAFWWGCCLGVVGLALTYFMTNNDRSQVSSAFWGCLIATLIWGIGGLWNPFSIHW